jgi:hypothetical protein
MAIGQWAGWKACCMWCPISDNEHTSEGSVRAELACSAACSGFQLPVDIYRHLVRQLHLLSGMVFDGAFVVQSSIYIM